MREAGLMWGRGRGQRGHLARARTAAQPGLRCMPITLLHSLLPERRAAACSPAPLLPAPVLAAPHVDAIVRQQGNLAVGGQVASGILDLQVDEAPTGAVARVQHASGRHCKGDRAGQLKPRRICVPMKRLQGRGRAAPRDVEKVLRAVSRGAPWCSLACSIVSCTPCRAMHSGRGRTAVTGRPHL